MKNTNGLRASGLFTSRALTRAVNASFDSRVLRSAALASGLALAVVTSAQAATLTVTNTNSAGTGSFAAALQLANNNADESDTIVFASAVTGTIDLSQQVNRTVVVGDLRIQGPGKDRLTLKGVRLIADYGDDPNFLFYADYGRLTISDVTLEGSHLSSSGPFGAGYTSVDRCAVRGGRLSGALTVSNSHVDAAEVLVGSGLFATQSTVTRTPILAWGDVTLIDSIVTGSPDDGINANSSEPNERLITVRNSVISGSKGAGLRVLGANSVVVVENSTIANNGGDGIHLGQTIQIDATYPFYGSFDLAVKNATISGNGGRAVNALSGDFNAVYGHVPDIVVPTPASKLRVDNSTVVGNADGGVRVLLGDGGHLASTSRITRTTIAANAADRGGGVSVVRAASETVVGPASTIAFNSTLIGKNTASVAGPDLFTDVPGFTFKADYSLIQNPAGAPITSTVAGSNITGQDPKLLRLANLGGTTSVRALGAGSPALNKGNPSLANVPATDQRGTGFPRVAGGRIDIGAFEQQSVDVAPVVLRSLPDVTGNGTPELAALVQSIPTGATTVRVRDALTGAAHWQVTLPGAGEAIDLETLGDVNGNGKRDIAVLRTAPASVAIRDGLTGAAVRSIALTSGFFPKALATLADVNGNGKPDVAVLGTKAGKSVVELRDSQTGALIKSTTFNSPGTPRDIVALRQEAGNASSAALLGVLMDVRDPTQSDSLEIRNALTGALVTRGNVGAGAESMEAMVLPDSNGNSGNEFAVLKSSGEVRVFDLPGFAPMTTMQFIAGDAALHLTAVPDTNGSGVTELAVMSRHQADGALKAEVRDAATGALIKTMDYSAQYRADELVSVPDINNNGVAELSHVGPNSSGVVRATQRDVTTGLLSSRVNLVP